MRSGQNYLFIYASLIEKKKPSSHATHRIANTGFYFSHMQDVSRIALDQERLGQLPDFDLPAYLLMDS